MHYAANAVHTTNASAHMLANLVNMHDKVEQEMRADYGGTLL
jgi:hypothetical protein